MTSIDQAVILCGGLGTRLHPYTLNLPKPMISTNGRPFLVYLIDQLREQGIKRIVLLTGYRGEQIEQHFGNGNAFGVEISYSAGPVEWETARRISEARAQLEDRFLLLYSDNFVPLQLAKLLAFHDARGCPVTVSLCKKAKGNIRVNKAGGIVEAYDSSRQEPGLDYVEVGYMIVEKDQTLAAITEPNASFSNVLRAFAKSAKLAGLVLPDRYQSISDPERWRLAESYLAPKRLLLLDRDGTLNTRPLKGGYVSSWSAFEWLPGTHEALKTLAEAGFSFALITNQAGVARGMVTQSAVDEIHTNLVAELRPYGVEILKVYVCPHHWDDGCECRKPLPGMLIQASRDLNLRLDRAVYVGDDTRDCQTADAANCVSFYVGDPDELGTLSPQCQPQVAGASLNDVVPAIIALYETWEKQDAAALAS
jgi:histidinol-phosphate phosphatase family protein